MDVGPLPIAGSDSTPMNTMYRLNDFRVVLGASFRIVVDVGGWDNSVCINAPGQSGDPRSPHYGDLALPWSLRRVRAAPLQPRSDRCSGRGNHHARAGIAAVRGHGLLLDDLERRSARWHEVKFAQASVKTP